jgi:hypothetical protein
MRGNKPTDMEVDGYPLGDYLTGSQYDPTDRGVYTMYEEGGSDGDENDMAVCLPTTDAGDVAYQIYHWKAELYGVPSHVIMNKVGNLCNRYNHRIMGTNSEQNFIQRIVSQQCETSHPLLYPMSTLFPSHFYAEAKHDSCSILGDVPICCYSCDTHPFGFYFQLECGRALATSSSLSTRTCPTLLAYVYDVLTNDAMSNSNSRLVERHGFKVDVVSPHGMSLRDKEQNDLLKSVDSHQAALDLAAAMPHVEFNIFLTFTCNQKLHPGVKHLHKFKESMEWIGFISGYLRMSLREKEEIKRLYELANGAILGRVWYEVRRIFLRYLMFSKTSMFRRVKKSFWRDEYQDCSGNLCHIMGWLRLIRRICQMKNF